MEKFNFLFWALSNTLGYNNITKPINPYPALGIYGRFFNMLSMIESNLLL